MRMESSIRMNIYYRPPIKKEDRGGQIPLHLPLHKTELTGSSERDKPTEKRGSTELDYRV